MSLLRKVFQSKFDQNLPAFCVDKKNLFPWKNHWFSLNFYMYSLVWVDWWLDWQEQCAKVNLIKFALIYLISLPLFSEQNLESLWLPKEMSYLTKDIFEFQCYRDWMSKTKIFIWKDQYALLQRNSWQLILPLYIGNNYFVEGLLLSCIMTDM